MKKSKTFKLLLLLGLTPYLALAQYTGGSGKGDAAASIGIPTAVPLENAQYIGGSGKGDARILQDFTPLDGIYFTGATNNNFATASNWNINAFPGTSQSAEIRSGGTQPVLSGSQTIAAGTTINILSGASLTVAPAGVLTVNGTLNNSGTLTLLSDTTGSGAIGNSSGTITGNVTVQRFVSGGKRAFRFFSHPFSSPIALSNMMASTGLIITGSNGASNGFDASILNNPSAFTFSEAAFNGTNNSGWNAFTNTSNTIAVGAGIRALHRGARTQLPAAVASNPPTPQSATISWSGNISAGNKNFSMTNTGGGNAGWNLIGNPYPSAVNVGQIAAGNRNSIGNFYVWNPNMAAAGAYETKSFGADYILPSGSAFFINTPSAANFTFTESDKSTSAPAVLHKNNELMQNALELQLISDSSIHWDNFVLRNRSQLTDAFEYTADGLKMKNSDVNVFSISSDNQNLSIDNRALNESKEVNLAFETSSPYHFTFKVSHIQMAGLEIYLEDKFTNQEVLLTQNTAYDFVSTADPASQGSARFKLKFKNSATSTEEVLFSNTQLAVYPNPAVDVLNINISNASFKNSSVTITNVSGKQLINTNMSGANTQINIEGLSNGIYFVNITNENGFKKTVKFVK